MTSIGISFDILYRFIKRFFDIFLSLVGLILLIPIALFIKIAYLLTGDYDSIFFHQVRVGKNGRKFKMFKIRTMCPDADKKLADILKDPEYKKEWKKYHKLENDPRITKVGRLIRHGSIDETPQFINVLFGQLSLIGPRPLVPGEIEDLGGEKDLYESIKPGITGWWAVNGRSDTKVIDRLTLEYYYINNQSLLLDIKIFFKTFFAIFTKKGVQ